MMGFIEDMETETIEQRILRFKYQAKIFLENRIPTFIKDIYGTYYSCIILECGELKIHVRCFKGKLIGQEPKIYWAEIAEIHEHNGM